VDVAGATVVVTGASSGIGAALAPLLAERGATVVAVARRADRLAEVVARCQAHAPASTAVAADLSDPAAAESLARRLDDELGGIDVLVNNAAAPMRRHVQRLTVAELQRTMALNFETPVRMTMALLPGMLARDRGSIVNVSSFGGRAGIPAESAYCASKFALTGWTEVLAMDLAFTGVDVRLITPGAVATEIWDAPDNDPAHYAGELAPAEEVAAGIVEAIEGEQFEHYLPDLKAIVEFKTSDLDGYIAGVVAFAADAEHR
jgi:short-subunit dehydrogenase